ncbi:MAG: HNH endonuclease [Syntrophobacteraceae bacterium]
MTCIFCRKPAVGATVSHVLPASLGGEKWACLPDGLVCSQCNQYFGDNVERLALSSFPFLPFRVFLGIPTKKGRAPKMATRLGMIRGSINPGQIGIDPASLDIEEAIVQGKISQMRILAEPTEPVAVCRMLVKMGLEVVALDSPDDARSTKFDSARRFARRPCRGMEWWFFIYTNHLGLFSKFRHGISVEDWVNSVSLSVCQFDEFEAFRLQLLDMIIFTPLGARVLPPETKEFPEPDYRLFRVRN